MIGASAIDTQGYMGQAYEALGAVNWYPNTAMMLGLSYTFTSFSKDAVALGRLRSSNGDGLSYRYPAAARTVRILIIRYVFTIDPTYLCPRPRPTMG